MAYDTPARIVIVGAGPIGIEAALYARFLGYEVSVYEQGEVGQNLREQADQPLGSTWDQQTSPLGLAAIRAHDETYCAPDAGTRLNCGQWVTDYLELVAATDLLADSIETQALITDCVFVGNANDSEANTEGEHETDEAESGGMLLIRGLRGDDYFRDRADIFIEARGTGSHSAQSPEHGDNVLLNDVFFDNVIFDNVLCDIERPVATESKTADIDRPEVEPADLLFRRVVPNYYVLGPTADSSEIENSYQLGLRQIRQLFSIIGGRETLDLYASMETQS